MKCGNMFYSDKQVKKGVERLRFLLIFDENQVCNLQRKCRKGYKSE